MPSDIGRVLGAQTDRIYPPGDAAPITYPVAAAIVVSQSTQTITAIGEVIADTNECPIFQTGEPVMFQEGELVIFQPAG